MDKVSMKKILFLLLALNLVGCSKCGNGKFKKNVDLTGIEVNLEVHRFEREFINVQPEAIDSGLARLQTKYPDFLPFYVEELMQFGKLNDPKKEYIALIKQFLTNRYVQGLHDTCKLIFPDLEKEMQYLETAFRQYRYFYPKRPIPKVITYVSEFSRAAVTYDSTILGIGLDLYLGKDYKYYPSLFPGYLVEKLEPNYMVPNCMKVWVNMLYQEKAQRKSFLEEIIYNGKVLYFLDQVLMETHDHFKIGFQPQQLVWCRN